MAGADVSIIVYYDRRGNMISNITHETYGRTRFGLVDHHNRPDRLISIKDRVLLSRPHEDGYVRHVAGCSSVVDAR